MRTQPSRIGETVAFARSSMQTPCISKLKSSVTFAAMKASEILTPVAVVLLW